MNDADQAGNTDAASARQDRLDPQVVRSSLVIVLGTFMAVMDTTIVTVALTTLAKDFHTSLASIQWVTTGYLLALAMVVPITGWGVHRFGAKRLYLIALVIFSISSALCGLAWSVPSLIAFRILQGVGGGMILPVGQTIRAQAAGPAQMNRIMAITGVPVLMGPILGPVIGGLIVSNASWRWIFYVNIPIAVLAILAAVKVLPDVPGDGGHRFDLPGFLLLSPGLAIFVYGLTRIGSAGSVDITGLSLIILGLVMVLGFVLRSRRAPEPLMDMTLFRHRDFSVASICIYLTGAVAFGTMFLLPLYFQIVRGASPLTAGLLLLPQGIGAALLMRFSAKSADRYGPRIVTIIGFVFMALGTLVYTQVTATTSLSILCAALFVRGAGLGLAMSPAVAASYNGLSHRAIPRATTATSILRQVGGSIGVALFSVVLTNHMAAKLPVVSKTGTSIGELPGGHLPAVVAARMAEAFASTFWWSFSATILAIIPALFLTNKRNLDAEDPHSVELLLD
jgi:EmrB/QacA subfamily drug resistance transporter